MHIFDFRFSGFADIGGTRMDFQPFEESTSGTVQYFGYVSAEGYWLILKRDASGATTTYTYCVGQGSHKTAFTNRASQTYVEFTAIGA